MRLQKVAFYDLVTDFDEALECARHAKATANATAAVKLQVRLLPRAWPRPRYCKGTCQDWGLFDAPAPALFLRKAMCASLLVFH